MVNGFRLAGHSGKRIGDECPIVCWVVSKLDSVFSMNSRRLFAFLSSHSFTPSVLSTAQLGQRNSRMLDSLPALHLVRRALWRAKELKSTGSSLHTFDFVVVNSHLHGFRLYQAHSVPHTSPLR